MTAVITAYLGCNPCGTRWVGETPCWMCGDEGVEATRPVMGDGGQRYGAPGMYADVAAAITRGPTLTDDPCGGGPL